MDLLMSSEGFEKIMSSLRTLPNVEIFNHDFRGKLLEDYIGEKIAFCQFNLNVEVFSKIATIENPEIW